MTDAPSRAADLPAWFVDQRGRRWFCAQRYLSEGRDTVSCEEERGAFTAASLYVFRRWGWTSARKDGSSQQGKAND